MKKQQEMLTITMEECGELIQACSKIIRFEDDKCPDDILNLQQEIGDVLCMVEIIKEAGLVNETQIIERMAVKREKLKKWSSLFNED